MMRRLHLPLPFILAMLACTLLLNAQQPVVQNLMVEDVPDDDGSGLVLSWTPLPQEDRIIEYRIYRGLSPDSLFFIGSIPVNPNVTLSADKMYYYDKDYTGFVSIDSPGKLKPEKQQEEGSPLFQEIPRDLTITGPMLSHYRILGVIPAEEYYYHTTKVVYPAEEPADSTAEQAEDEVWAGLKIRQINMYKKLMTNHTYWYTVLAVNESRRFYPYAAPVMGIPRDNAPESIGKQFYAAYVDGLENDWLQFEWEYPLTQSDVVLFNVYMMSKDDLPAFEQYNNFLRDTEAYKMDVLAYRELVVDEVGKVIMKLEEAGAVSAGTLSSLEEFKQTVRQTPGSQMADAREALLAGIAEANPADEPVVRPLLERIKYNASAEVPMLMADAEEPGEDFAPKLVLSAPETVQNPASLIYRDQRMLSPLPPNVARIELDERGHIVDTDWDIDVLVNRENLQDYAFAFSIYDASGAETFSNVKFLYADGPDKNILTEDELPMLPDNFIVMDKPNDKGDYNSVMWGRPVVQLTKSEFMDDAHTKLRVNYDLVTNSLFEIKNVYFEVYDNFTEGAEPICKVNEFYQDAKIIVTLPEGTDYKNTPLTFVMRFRTNKDEELGEDYAFIQNLEWSDESRSLAPQKLLFQGENVNDFSYLIFNQAQQDPMFSLAKKAQGNQRELDDSISYTENVFKSVGRWDAEHDVVLVGTSLDIIRDHEYDVDLSTDIYGSQQEQYVEDVDTYTTELTELQAQQAEQLEVFRQSAEAAKGEAAAVAQRLIAATQAWLANMDDEAVIREFKLAWIAMNNAGMLEGQMDLEQVHMQIERTHGNLVEAQRQLENPVMQRSFEFQSNKARMKYLVSKRHRDMRTYRYYMVKSDGQARFNQSPVYVNPEGKEWFFPVSNWFDTDKIVMLIATFIFGFLVFYMIRKARMGHDLYLRPIAGIQEIDNAIGRATEMGRPILFVPGLSGISDVATLAGLSILGKVAKKAAEYDTRILVPCRDYIVLPIAQSIVREAHYEAGRPDTYDKNSVFFITTSQFAFVAGVNGIMIREKTATNFYMGMFYAESLIMTETGTVTGAIQISGTDAVTQIPFFITTCDYTLIGEELYAAAAYLAREPKMLGTLKAQDYFKFLILTFIIAGTIFSTAHATFLINAFPEK